MDVMQLYLLSFFRIKATAAALGRSMHREPAVYSAVILKASVETDSRECSGENMGWLENRPNRV